ncbi:MAG: cell wall-binding repeat-containing protein [Oscillospiraceae bacterium]|nr:cell wall-binding repeat-containing protein [Oscillospiraceae bacterium]
MLAFLIVFTFPQQVFAADDTVIYDRRGAVKWAREHIAQEEATGLTCDLVCDKFVKECMKAGGIDVSHVGDVTPIMKALVEAQLGEMMDVVMNEDGMYVNKADNPWLEAGDVIGFFCNTCGDHSHMAFIAGFDEDGNAQAYAHNRTWNLKTNFGTYFHTDSRTGQEHKDGFSIDAVHITNNTFHNHSFELYDSDGDKFYEKEHPHRYYAICDCGIKYHLFSGLSYVSACTVCNPPLADVPVVTAQVNDENLVSLKWSAVPDTLYYNVYRANKRDGEYSKISSDLTFTSFKNPNTKNFPGRTFYYKVKAVRANEADSVFSDVVCITVSPGAEFHRYSALAAVKPTCTQPGLTEGLHCPECGQIYVKQKTVPATGHLYDIIVPNGDGTVEAECSVCGHKDTLKSAERIKGKDRYATSFAIANKTKAKMGTDKFDNIIIASGTNFADALAGSYLAAVKDAPILISSGKNDAQLRDYIAENLRVGGTIYILGGTAAVPQSTEDTLVGYNVKRLKGKSRYETNIEILKEAGVTNEDILVATGTNFADSLSASAVGKPILLVDGKKMLTQVQKDYLDSLTTNNLYILGGTGAVGASYESELAAYGSVERVKGASRYETSVAIAQKFFADPDYAVIAFAENFPDGLCGGPLAMTMNSPVILTKTGKQSRAKEYTQSNNVSTGIVLGGASLIDDATAKDIFNAEIIYVP